MSQTPYPAIMTAGRLDEFDDCAREADRVVLTSSDLGSLVAVARAALAWGEARAAHRDVCNEPSYLTSLVASRIPTLERYQRAIEALYRLTQGTP